MMHRTFHDQFSRFKSTLAYSMCIGFTLLIVSLLVLVIGYLLHIGFSSINTDFFTQLPTGDPAHPGGMKHAIIGTVILIGMASAVGIPLGMLAGIYLAEYDVGSAIAGPVRFVADVLAGVPSIVVGILGYELLVAPTDLYFFKLGLGHYNGWAGALALAFIMVPIIARTTEEMLRLVPSSYREASIALGATKARTILNVVLPSATGSVITGIMLAIARVAGETAPLLFTALGSRLLTADPNQPFPSLTVQIFNYATGPYPEQKRLAWAGILVLIAMIFVMNLSIRFFAKRRTA